MTMTASKRSQLIQRTRNSASALRGLAYTSPLSYEEKQDMYNAAQNLEEAAHRISLDDYDGQTRELILFAYLLANVSGAAIGVIATLLLT